MPSSSTGTERGARARTERIARGLALLLAILAVAGVTTAWLVNRNDDRQRDQVAGRVPAALVTSTPAAIVPVTSALPTSTTPAAPKTHRSAAPKPQAPKPIVAPTVPQHLYVPAIKVNTTVAPKPTEMAHDPFLGKQVPSFGVPDDMYTTTWWSSGPKTGAAGMAVILGHTQIGGYGVFNDLSKLKRGDVVGVQRGATVLKFAVLAVRTGISKKDPNALASVLNNHPAAARLALLTCSGDFNQGYRESAENTVVFTRLVSVTH